MTPTAANIALIRFANFRTRKSTPFAPSPRHHSILMTHYSRPLSTFALFTQKRVFLPFSRPSSPPPTHHSLLRTHHSSPMSTFALFTQKRGFSCFPSRVSAPSTHHSSLVTHHSIPLSIFALFAQKRGFGAAGVPTGDPPPGRASPTKKMNKVSILNTFTLRPQKRRFSPPHFPNSSLITPHPSLFPLEHLRIIRSKTRFFPRHPLKPLRKFAWKSPQCFPPGRENFGVQRACG